jgi:hypothetical protein
MKKLLLLPFLLFVVNGYAQKITKVEKISDHSTYIKGRDFEGCVFGSNYIAIYSREQNATSYTPSADEIILAEKILRQTIDTIHYYGHEYFVRKNLKKYIRQYFGYVSATGEKVIYISALWKNNKDRQWLTDYISVEDGGDYYWQIKINLSSQKCLMFSINGEA